MPVPNESVNIGELMFFRADESAPSGYRRVPLMGDARKKALGDFYHGRDLNGLIPGAYGPGKMNLPHSAIRWNNEYYQWK